MKKNNKTEKKNQIKNFHVEKRLSSVGTYASTYIGTCTEDMFCPVTVAVDWVD